MLHNFRSNSAKPCTSQSRSLSRWRLQLSKRNATEQTSKSRLRNGASDTAQRMASVSSRCQAGRGIASTHQGTAMTYTHQPQPSRINRPRHITTAIFPGQAISQAVMIAYKAARITHILCPQTLDVVSMESNGMLYGKFEGRIFLKLALLQTRGTIKTMETKIRLKDCTA